MSKQEDREKVFKIVVAGNSGVGKTNLVARYTEDQFDESYKTTIGLDFKFKETTVGGEACRIQIWDTAGQEKMKAVAASYYKNSNGIAIIFDVANRESYDKIGFWLNEARNNVPLDVAFIIIGNKNDLIEKRKVSMEEAKAYAEEQGLFYVETSAKENQDDCVSKAFEQLIGDILRRAHLNEEKETVKVRGSKSKQISIGEEPQVAKKGCC